VFELQSMETPEPGLCALKLEESHTVTHGRLALVAITLTNPQTHAAMTAHANNATVTSLCLKLQRQPQPLVFHLAAHGLLDSGFQIPANPQPPSQPPGKWQAYVEGGTKEDDARTLQMNMRRADCDSSASETSRRCLRAERPRKYTP
jgi:hypothetical protein